MAYDNLIYAAQEGIATLTLYRPDARNALNNALLGEVAAALDAAAEDEAVRVAIVTGGLKVFAAGADIKEMAALDMIGVMDDPRPGYWRRIAAFPKPLIAAVNGYALGGGCELMMHADIVIAGAGARFGQPEINLGIIPGAGGTQRLIRAVGKPLAMKLVLSGEFIDATTALQAGLIAEVVEDDQTLERAQALAAAIAGKSPVALRLAKESLLKAYETTLEAGLAFERKAFTLLAATEDRREGIAAFTEKRAPRFKGR